MIIVEVEFEPTAAAVLALGVLQLSPIANTFGNLVCCSVSRVTVTKPVAGSAKSLERTASTVDIGGEMCRKPYCWTRNKFVTNTSSLVSVQLCRTDWLREGFLRVDVLERRQLLVVVDLDQVRARCESDVPALHIRLVTRSALVQGSTCYATHCLPVVDDLHQGFGVFLDPENCRQRRDVVNVCFVSLSILLRMTQNYCQSLLKAKHKK